MELDEVNQMWAKDCKFDETNLGGEALRIPTMHNKYFNLYSQEGLKLRRQKSQLLELEKAKMEYYNGSMDDAELKQRGWKPNPLKILRADINRYIETDKDIINMSLRIDYQRAIVEYLEDIIKQINQRNFYINNAVAMLKFQSGGF